MPRRARPSSALRWRPRILRLIADAFGLLLGLQVRPRVLPGDIPVGFELVAPVSPERQVAREVFERCLQGGEVILGDKDLAGRELADSVHVLGAAVRPSGRATSRSARALAPHRQWAESTHNAYVRWQPAISLTIQLGQLPRPFVVDAV
jgi:hypothetical protein